MRRPTALLCTATIASVLLLAAAPGGAVPIACSPSPVANCVANGDFESGTMAGWTFTNACPGMTCDRTGCSQAIGPGPNNFCAGTGACCGGGCAFLWRSDCPSLFNQVHCGNYSGFLFGGDCSSVTFSTLCTTFTVPAGGALFSFWYALERDQNPGAPGANPPIQQLDLTASGAGCTPANVWSAVYNPAACLGWTQALINLCNYGGCTMTLCLRSHRGGNGNTCNAIFIDDLECRPCAATSPTNTPTFPALSPTITVTATRTVTATATVTSTPLPGSPTVTATPAIGTPTNTFTITATPTETPTVTPTVVILPVSYTFTFTQTFSFTTTVTGTPTATPALQVSIRIYDEAGELVRTIRQGLKPMGSAPGSCDLQPNPFSPDFDGVEDSLFATFPDGQQVSWDGLSERGELVSNGSYWMRISLVDALGIQIADFQRRAVVLGRANFMSLELYDSAGRRVRRFPTYRGPIQWRDVDAQPNPFVPGWSKTTQSWKTCRINLFARNENYPGVAPTASPYPNFFPTTVWLGDDGGGNILPNGTYSLLLTNIDSQGKKVTIVKTITILRGTVTLLTDLRSYPNPFVPDKGSDLYFAYTIVSGDTTYVSLRIFDLQGHLVATRDSARDGSPDPSGSPNRFRIDWNGMTLDRGYVADGLYLAEFSAMDMANGLRQTTHLKFAISRKR